MDNHWLEPLAGQRLYTVIRDRFPLPVIVFEHHRFTLPVLWLARRAGGLKDAVPLVYFDRHPDQLTSPDIAAHAAFFAQATSFEEVVRYTDERMSICNDDWVRTAVACGFVSAYTHISSTEQKVPLHDGAWWCDVDLDYFADEDARKRITPWDAERIEADVVARAAFWSSVKKNTPCVTVARESEFCGGIDGMKEIRRAFLAALR